MKRITCDIPLINQKYHAIIILNTEQKTTFVVLFLFDTKIYFLRIQRKEISK